MAPLIDCRDFDEQFVIHYGGEFHQVNAYTFASSLIALSDAIRNANHIVNPGYDIEIVVEALGPGSFRARIRAVQKGINNLFSAQDAKTVVLSIIAAMIYEHTLAPNPVPIINVSEDMVVIEQGDQKIVIPKDANNYYEEVKKSEPVRNNIARAFSVLEKDESVENFGITKSLDDPEPLITITRHQFSLLSNELIIEEDIRESIERTHLQIVRAILERSKRRWEFVWNGIKISAPVTDNDFYNEFFAHRITIAPGDSLEVNLKIIQVRNPDTGIYTNQSYEVIKVFKHIPRVEQQALRDID